MRHDCFVLKENHMKLAAALVLAYAAAFLAAGAPILHGVCSVMVTMVAGR